MGKQVGPKALQKAMGALLGAERLVLARAGRRRRRGRGELFDCRLLKPSGIRRAREVRGWRLRYGGELVACLFPGHTFRILAANALDLEVWRIQVLVWQENYVHVLPLLDLENGAALLVEKESGHIDGQLGQDAVGALLHRFFFHDAQNGQCQRLDAPDGALTAATRTDELARLPQ